MSNIEIIGVVVVGLAAIIGLLIQGINLISKITEPFKVTLQDFIEAVNSLKLVVERLVVGHKNIEEEMKWHTDQLAELKKEVNGIQLNCARKHHDT